MEKELLCQYKNLLEKGMKVKSWWFEMKSKELMNAMHPGISFHFSAGWFTSFKQRNNISICVTLNSNSYSDISID